MDYKAYDIDEVSDDKINTMIQNGESFFLKNCERKFMQEIARKIESIVETNGIKCSILTKGRVIAAGASAIVNPLVAIAAAYGILGHRLVTSNAEYVIKKNFLTRTVEVTYREKKGKKEKS